MINYDKSLRSLMEFSRLGTGSFVATASGMWWCIGKRKFWSEYQGYPLLTFTAIGGAVDRGESILAAVSRETLEETASTCTILSARSTQIGRLGTQDWETRRLDMEPRPAVIYHSDAVQISVVTFWVSLNSEPRPSSEIPALIWIPAGSEPVEPVSLKRLLSRGVRLELKDEIPADAFLAPYGTAEIWARMNQELREAITPTESQSSG